MLNFCLRMLVLVCLMTSLALPAAALTETQVVERLANIPVFIITDRDGIPLVGSNNEQESNPVLPFFLNPQEAEATLKTIENPELKAQVIARSLKDMYDFVQNNQNKDLVFQIVPSESSLQAATAIVGGDKLPNVPVFFALDRQEKDKEGLFTVSQGEQLFIPFFFEKEELDRLIGEVNNNDETKTAPEIKVISFFQVLNSMIDTEQNKTTSDVERFTFFPSQNSFQWIETNVKEGEIDILPAASSGDS